MGVIRGASVAAHPTGETSCAAVVGITDVSLVIIIVPHHVVKDVMGRVSWIGTLIRNRIPFYIRGKWRWSMSCNCGQDAKALNEVAVVVV